MARLWEWSGLLFRAPQTAVEFQCGLMLHSAKWEGTGVGTQRYGAFNTAPTTWGFAPKWHQQPVSSKVWSCLCREYARDAAHRQQSQAALPTTVVWGRTNRTSQQRGGTTRLETRLNGPTTRSASNSAAVECLHQLCTQHFSSSTIFITLSLCVRHAGLPPAKKQNKPHSSVTAPIYLSIYQKSCWTWHARLLKTIFSTCIKHLFLVNFRSNCYKCF